MKKYILYLSILLTLSAFQVFGGVEITKWGAVTNGLQMSINLDDGMRVIKTNQSLVLLIHYRNISTNETFYISHANALEYDPSYTWIVISPSGKDISPDTFANMSESWGRLALKPNQSKEIEFNLSLLCKFDEIGVYKIVAKKSVYSFARQKAFEVVSNPLYVTAVPAQ